jgi:DNA-binding transcriptional MerR regulator
MTPGSGRLLIGALASQAGLSRDTLRFYEKLGLLRPAGRTTGGFRWYGPEALHRVRVIQRALIIGFSLSELASLFRDRAAGKPPCRRARALAAQKLDALSAQISLLVQLRRQLRTTLAAWDERLAEAGPQAPAHLLDGLADAPAPRRARTRQPGIPAAWRRAS